MKKLGRQNKQHQMAELAFELASQTPEATFPISE